jgi:hypothetical protein
MAEDYNVFVNRKKSGIFLLAIIILLLLLAVVFLSGYFLNKKNSYSIQNKYYGFTLKTPAVWLGQENTDYSEENIAQILDECKSNRSNNTYAYEIGVFRFESNKFLEGFKDAGYSFNKVPSGAAIEIVINCIPDNASDKITDYSYSNLKIGEEKAIEGVIGGLEGFDSAKYFSFTHNGFDYEISEYVYISPDDAGENGEKLKNSYEQIFDKIISSFKFIK